MALDKCGLKAWVDVTPREAGDIRGDFGEGGTAGGRGPMRGCPGAWREVAIGRLVWWRCQASMPEQGPGIQDANQGSGRLCDSWPFLLGTWLLGVVPPAGLPCSSPLSLRSGEEGPILSRFGPMLGAPSLGL